MNEDSCSCFNASVLAMSGQTELYAHEFCVAATTKEFQDRSSRGIISFSTFWSKISQYLNEYTVVSYDVNGMLDMFRKLLKTWEIDDVHRGVRIIDIRSKAQTCMNLREYTLSDICRGAESGMGNPVPRDTPAETIRFLYNYLGRKREWSEEDTEVVGIGCDDLGQLNVLADEAVYDKLDDEDMLNLNHRQCVVTGNFICGTRKDIFDLISNAGGIPKICVTEATDYLFVGGYGSIMWEKDKPGFILAKALELKKKGARLKIIPESVLIEKLYPEKAIKLRNTKQMHR